MQSALLNVMTAAVLKATKGLLRDFSEVDQLQVSKKGTANFVTAADTRVEKILQRELAHARPGYSFLMEEGGEIAGEDAEYRWIIDPLDGTTNFIHAIPYFSVTVALEKRLPEGGSEIIAGVVYDPIHNELFTAEKGKGAFLNDRKIRIRHRDDIERALFATGAPRKGKKEYTRSLRMLNAVTQHSIGIRCFGSAALDLAYIAAGRIDGYWHTALKPWDIAAGMLLVQEAGGKVTDMEGGQDLLQTGQIIAASQNIHSLLSTILSNAVRRM